MNRLGGLVLLATERLKAEKKDNASLKGSKFSFGYGQSLYAGAPPPIRVHLTPSLGAYGFEVTPQPSQRQIALTWSNATASAWTSQTPPGKRP